MANVRTQTDHIGKRKRSLPGHADILEPGLVADVMDLAFGIAANEGRKTATRAIAAEICISVATGGQANRYYNPSTGRLSVGITGQVRALRPIALADHNTVARAEVGLPPMLVHVHRRCRNFTCFKRDEKNLMDELREKVGYHFSRGELVNALSVWLRRKCVDDSIAGILQNENVRRAPQLAYAAVSAGIVQATFSQFQREMFSRPIERRAKWLQGHKKPNLFVDEYIPDRKEQRSQRMVGAGLAVSESKLKEIVAEFRRQVVAVSADAPATDVGERHQVVVLWMWFFLGLLTGHRDTVAPFEQSTDFDLLRKRLYIEDKVSRTGASGRVVPLLDIAVEQVEHYRVYLEQLSRRFHNLNPSLSGSIRGALDSSRAFLGLIDEGIWRPITPKDCERVFGGAFPGRQNFPRHFLYQAMRNRKVTSELQNMFFGHASIGDDYFSIFSSSSLVQLREVTFAIDDFATSIGLEPINFVAKEV